MSESRPTSPADQKTRDQAIDPAGSFAVQAPAGSGKTELLTQRFLRLLALVERPEQVLAVTFTRKATREMVDRVMERLRVAASGEAPEAAHQRRAHELALGVLQRDAELGWRLLERPSRLQIHTIDGLCARLAARSTGQPLPLAGLAVAEHPQPMYREAARRTIDEASRALDGAPERQALEHLLLRERGDANRLTDLLASELPRRDQWRETMTSGAGDVPGLLSLRQRLELKVLEAHLGRETLESAGAALARLAPLTDEPNPDDPLPEALEALARDGATASPDVRAWAYWNILAALKKKSSDEPYSAAYVNRSVYPGASPARTDEVDALKVIVAAWYEDPDAIAAYTRFIKAPPLDRVPGDGSLVADLRRLLLRACDHLESCFAESGACDFQHVAQLALAALGDEDAPGEALLIEDGRLMHVLIDEFQDTSRLQYELVERLVAGWLPDEQRSLFLVGDPMQSIYRFRKAEVDLFRDLLARASLGPVELTPLELTVNFRSTATVIEAVNAMGRSVFQPPSPVSVGHVGYTPVDAFAGAGGGIEFHAFPPGEGGGPGAEAEWIAYRIRELLEDGEAASIGVLARKRKHLEPIGSALAQLGVPFEAVEVQSLEHRPVVLDLLTLVRALLHPGDRVAWLGVLLGPWCALQPGDLLQVAGALNEANLFERLRDPGILDALAPQVRERVDFIARALAPAVASAGQVPLARRVEAAWAALGGPRVARSPEDLDDADVFLRLLARVERDSPEDLAAVLVERLEFLYAGSGTGAVKLMTVHKAKGLEFDAVFLPSMQGTGPGPNRSLFRSLDIPVEGDLRGALQGPMPPANEVLPSLYGHLGLLESEARESELQRLLYVAMTRARRYLAMTASVAPKKDGTLGSFKGSFLEFMRPHFEPLVEVMELEDSPVPDGPPMRPLVRLAAATASLHAPAKPDPATIDGSAEPVTLGAPPPARDRLALGEALHHWLELMHDHWSDRWLGEWYGDHSEALRSSLAIAGAPRAVLPDLEKELVALLRGLLAKEDVRETLTPDGKRRSLAEAVYLSPEGPRLKKLIVDRLYQDSDGAWHVVDYKTGAEAEETRDKWRQQLEAYARTVTAAEDGVVASRRVLQASEGRFIDPE